MQNILTIAIREARSYFVSPLAYVAVFFFIFLTGFIFALDISHPQSVPRASMEGLFGSMVFLTLIVAPVLTMGLLARETSSGSIELLMSKPVRDVEVAVGKFVGALAVYLVMLIVSLELPIMYQVWGNPDWGVIASGYLGLFLCGAAFLAVGTFASSVTDNQIAAWLIGTVLLLFLWLVGFLGFGASGLLPEVARRVSFFESFSPFARGIVDGKNMIYFISVAVVFLFMAVRSIENRRTA